MNTVTSVVESQKSLFVKHAFKVKIRAFADEFYLDGKRCADGFRSLKFKHTQIVFKPFDSEREQCFVSRIEHVFFLKPDPQKLMSGINR